MTALQPREDRLGTGLVGGAQCVVCAALGERLCFLCEAQAEGSVSSPVHEASNA